MMSLSFVQTLQIYYDYKQFTLLMKKKQYNFSIICLWEIIINNFKNIHYQANWSLHSLLMPPLSLLLLHSGHHYYRIYDEVLLWECESMRVWEYEMWDVRVWECEITNISWALELQLVTAWWLHRGRDLSPVHRRHTQISPLHSSFSSSFSSSSFSPSFSSFISFSHYYFKGEEGDKVVIFPSYNI